MNSKLSAFILLVSVSSIYGGCGLFGGGDDATTTKPDPDPDTDTDTTVPAGSTYEETCARFDECNMLDGMSADECVQYFVECGDTLLASEESDMQVQLEECLSESDSCTDFSDCYAYDVPYC